MINPPFFIVHAIQWPDFIGAKSYHTSQCCDTNVTDVQERNCYASSVIERFLSMIIISPSTQHIVYPLSDYSDAVV